MPTDPKKWSEEQIELGRIPDENGYYHYTPEGGKRSKEMKTIISAYMEE